MSIESFIEFGKATEKVAAALGDLAQALDVVSQTPCFTTPLWKENPSVMISINPKWCELIASGRKTIEIRKTKPKIETPFKCYIYCTKDNFKSIFQSKPYLTTGNFNVCNGKVIGEFICDCILSHCEMANADIAEQQGCIKREKLFEYADSKELYGWHISDLVIYDKPKKLNEFRCPCKEYFEKDTPCCGDCEYYEERYEYPSECACEGMKPLKRPFQSWGYAENYTEAT